MPRQLLYLSSQLRWAAGARYIVTPVCAWLAQQGGEWAVKKLGLELEGDQVEAAGELVGSMAAAAVFGINTIFWQSQEKQTMKANCDRALGAELGVVGDPSQGDYRRSNNIIIQREIDDLEKYNALRWVNALAQPAFHLVRHVAHILMHKGSRVEGETTHWLADPLGKVKGAGDLELTHGGIAAYWAIETFSDKTPMYDLHALEEKTRMGADVTFNEIFMIMQRTRQIAKQPLYTDLERDGYLRPVVDYLAKLCNTPPKVINGDGVLVRPTVVNPLGEEVKRVEDFGTQHLVYLIGCDRLKIHDAEGKLLPPQQALEGCVGEIDRVARVGLDGIARQNANRPAPKRSDCVGVACEKRDLDARLPTIFQERAGQGLGALPLGV